jgi:hypothetical protein
MDRIGFVLGILAGLGIDTDDVIHANRRSGALDFVCLNEEADAIVLANADRIQQDTKAAGHEYRVKMVKGFPVLTDLDALTV